MFSADVIFLAGVGADSLQLWMTGSRYAEAGYRTLIYTYFCQDFTKGKKGEDDSWM